MNNFTQHFSHQPITLVILISALVLVILFVRYYSLQYKRYGSMLDFASPMSKITSGLSCVALAGVLIYGSTPYIAPPTGQVAIVLGNTQNTPAPKISAGITSGLISTLLLHKGATANDLVNSIKIISAIKHPEVINLDPSEMNLREIGDNSSNAQMSAEFDVRAIEQKINSLAPTDNGANYLEAILEARDNVEAGSKIIVIGSGLSDNGDLNFSKTNILTSTQDRQDVIQTVQKKYGYDYLRSYSVEFYGLGDTTPPQEPLSSLQKEIVRNIYQETIQGLGGTVTFDTTTQIGDTVKTNYVVGTTDTGCGDIGLIFDDDNLKFVSNQATFIDDSAAKGSLMTVKTLWDKYSDTIQSIQIDGYIAHYAGTDNLSQQRANLVRNALITLGIPSTKINATGRGFGPYQNDAQNRMVKVTISRNSDQCQN